MRMITAEEKAAPQYQSRPGYVVREVAGEYLLIPVLMQEDPETRIAVLNETGKFLWEQLKTPCSAEQLTAAMTEEYQVSGEQARADIMEFINSMQANKLVQESGGE